MKHFLKRLEALVTDLQHRYTSDIFFRTTLHIVAIQAALVAVSVVVFIVTLQYSSSRVAQAVIAHMTRIFENNISVSPEVLTQSINQVETNITILVFIAILAIAVLSGIVLSYITLRPTRNSLESQKLFISNIAHELRTPLTVIKTLTEVEQLSGTLPPSTRKTFEGILEEIERASGVINNLLSLNRLLRPERMEFENTDIGVIVDRVIARSRKAADERGIDIAVKKTDFGFVTGNPIALEQMIINLVNNAIQYTPKDKGGKILISMEPDYSGMMLISVSDNGIGINQQDLFHIFEPFYRGDKSRARNVKKGGSGLGLAIVNEIVRAHHGRVRIRSAVGKGTTITVFIPVGHGAPEKTKDAEGKPEHLNEVAIDFSSNSTPTNHTS